MALMQSEDDDMVRRAEQSSEESIIGKQACSVGPFTELVYHIYY